MKPTPLLILSDAPTAGTGLSRITKDLAVRIAAHLPEFRVGTIGYGGPYSRSLPFPQYSMDMSDWVIHNLPDVWADFAGEERGIILSIWDATRMLWFSRPENCIDNRLRHFLTDPPFAKWGYFPMDATGPHDKLTYSLKHIIEGYDRALAYSKWAEDILRRTLWKKPMLEGLTNLPHGIDTSVFYPRDRAEAKAKFGERISATTPKGGWFKIPEKSFMVGIVGTNQTRKDWGLAIQTVAELKKERPVNLWIHIDVLERHWSIPSLLNDFDLYKEAVVTNVQFTDEQMAWCYSASDVVLAIGLGEGFGFSAAESLACGTPVVAPDYGGGEFIPQEFVVNPVAYRLEGPYNSIRPVMNVTNFSFKASQAGKAGALMTGSLLPSAYDWDNLWPRWAEWFRKGIE